MSKKPSASKRSRHSPVTIRVRVPPAERRHRSTSTGRLLKIDEVARLLNLSRSTVYNLINRGDLPVLHFGRSVRIRLRDVHRLQR